MTWRFDGFDEIRCARRCWSASAGRATSRRITPSGEGADGRRCGSADLWRSVAGRLPGPGAHPGGCRPVRRARRAGRPRRAGAPGVAGRAGGRGAGLRPGPGRGARRGPGHLHKHRRGLGVGGRSPHARIAGARLREPRPSTRPRAGRRPRRRRPRGDPRRHRSPGHHGVPLWLLEGFADYVALHAVDLPGQHHGRPDDRRGPARRPARSCRGRRSSTRARPGSGRRTRAPGWPVSCSPRRAVRQPW